MGRKRTAAYKRERRAKNRQHRKELLSKSRNLSPERASRPIRVIFSQRRNQPVFDFTFQGQLYPVNQQTGKRLMEGKC